MKKFIIEYNRINEVTEIDKEVEKKGIIYNGFMEDGEQIQAYDMENGKLAPIVRFLIEDEDGETNIKMIVFFVIIISLIFFVGRRFFTGDDEKKITPKPTAPIIKQAEKVEAPKEQIKEESKQIIEDNEKEALKSQKNNAELETIKLTYENEAKNLKINKLDLENNEIKSQNQILLSENNILRENLKNLQAELESKRIREKNEPKDAFIYYLGDNVYQRCEKTTDEQIKANCKDLYYNFLKNE